MSSRSSIFSFSTVKSAPSLKVFIFTVIFLSIMIAVGKVSFFNLDNELNLLVPGDNIIALKNLNTNCSTKLPKIVIAGDSRNIDGIVTNSLTDKFNCPIANITLLGSRPWEPLKIFHLCSDNLQKTKIVFFDLDPLHFYESPKFLQSNNAYVLLREKGDFYPGYNYPYINSWKEDFFPIKLSLHQIIDILLKKRTPIKKVDQKNNNIKKISVSSLCTDERLNESIKVRQEAYFNDKLLPSLWQFIDECSQQKILVVFNQVPTFEGRNCMFDIENNCGIPPELCNTEIDRKFEEVYQELQKRDNVVFLGFRRFSDIGVTDDEEELFRDCHHLLPKGAEIYTKWLAEELMRNPKTRAALERE